MKLKNFMPIIIALSVTAAEFVAFVIWGKNMGAGNEMGFFLITTYFLFPLTTLILSAYLGYADYLFLLSFVPPMFLAQNFMPYILTGTFEIGMICLLTFIPAAVGAGIGILIKKLVKSAKKKKQKQ